MHPLQHHAVHPDRVMDAVLVIVQIPGYIRSPVKREQMNVFVRYYKLRYIRLSLKHFAEVSLGFPIIPCHQTVRIQDSPASLARVSPDLKSRVLRDEE